MRNEEYRHFVESVKNQEVEDPMPYDAIIHKEKSGEIAGFVRDNFIVETVDKNGDGRIIRVPSNISYTKQGEQWFKYFYDYYENVDQTAQQSFGSYYAVYDEKSRISFLAIPLTEETKRRESFNNLNTFLAQGSEPDVASLLKIIKSFDGIDFGVFGSRALDFGHKGVASDIDLVVYGPANYHEVITQLNNNLDLRRYIGLSEQSSKKIESDIEHYMQKFSFNRFEAEAIATRRKRYILEPGIKLSINCNFDKSSERPKIPTPIGSNKISDVSIEGIAVNTTFSSTLPRSVVVETAGQNTQVVTSRWSLKDFIREGERVQVKGALRETDDGVTFISLEGRHDIIKPIANSNKIYST